MEFAGQEGKSHRGTGGPDPNDRCYNCNRIGHWATECRVNLRRDNIRRRSPSYEKNRSRDSPRRSKQQSRSRSPQKSKKSEKVKIRNSSQR